MVLLLVLLSLIAYSLWLICTINKMGFRFRAFFVLECHCERQRSNLAFNDINTHKSEIAAPPCYYNLFVGGSQQSYCS
jgi:hypothetical protein